MAAKDIRRDLPGVQPNNFVAPGVPDNSAAILIEGLGGAAIELDSELAKVRLGKDLDAARSGYLVGEVEDAQDEEEKNDDELQAQLEKELAPFQRSMKKLAIAKDQGILRGERFQMQADAILQSHIAKRPGLGPEMRQIHATYTGGAIIETLMRREERMFREALSGGGEKAKAAEEAKKFQLQRYVDAGMGAKAGMLATAAPEVVNQEFLKDYPEIDRIEGTIKRAQTLKAGAEGVEAGYTLDRPVSLQTWQAEHDLALEEVLATFRMGHEDLNQQQDEDMFAGKIAEWQGALAKKKDSLEALRVRLGLKPEDIAGQMSVMKDLEEKLVKTMDGTVALEERKRRLETYALQLQWNLKQNQPMTSAMFELEKAGAHNLVKYMADSNPAMLRTQGEELQKFIMDGGGNPVEVASLSVGMAHNTLKDMFPQGSQTKNPYYDFAKGTKMLADMGKAFIVVPTDQAKVKPYVEWIQELSAYKEQMGKLLDEPQKKELEAAVRISAHKLLRVGYLALQQQVPGIKGHLLWNPDAGDEPFILKDKDPSGVGERAVDQANQQMAYREVLKVVQMLGGYASEQDAHNAILKSADEVMGQQNLYAVERAERASKAGGGQGATGVAGKGPAGTRGASVRWWER